MVLPPVQNCRSRSCPVAVSSGAVWFITRCLIHTAINLSLLKIILFETEQLILDKLIENYFPIFLNIHFEF